MPAVRRLKRRADFLRVARRCRKWAAPGLVLQAHRRGPPESKGGASPIGVGFTVSRKVGNAVHRNRARRRLRAAAALLLERDGRPGYDYVLIGRPATVTRPFPALLADLEQALKRTGRDGPRQPAADGARRGEAKENSRE